VATEEAGVLKPHFGQLLLDTDEVGDVVADEALEGEYVGDRGVLGVDADEDGDLAPAPVEEWAAATDKDAMGGGLVRWEAPSTPSNSLSRFGNCCCGLYCGRKPEEAPPPRAAGLPGPMAAAEVEDAKLVIVIALADMPHPGGNWMQLFLTASAFVCID
jgi:hypothetical protein